MGRGGERGSESTNENHGVHGITGSMHHWAPRNCNTYEGRALKSMESMECMELMECQAAIHPASQPVDMVLMFYCFWVAGSGRSSNSRGGL